jgi:2-aminomuconate deaminase
MKSPTARMVNSGGGHRSDAPLLVQYSRSRRVGDLLFLSGVSSRQPDNTIRGASRSPSGALEIDIRAQTVGCIENLRSALEAEGLQLGNLVDVTIFLVSMADYGGFNEAWNQFFDTSGPTRTTVAVHQLPDPGLAIEIKAIAAFAPRAT